MSRSRKSRPAGILCAVSSLPSADGIGTFGPEAFAFVDWLAEAGQRYWQVLPLSIPDSVGSPYAPVSSAAGNWMLISTTMLIKDGLLPRTWKRQAVEHRPIRHRAVAKRRWLELHAAYDYFLQHGTSAHGRRMQQFSRQAKDWLPDFVLYAALKERFDGQPWWHWPKKYQSIITARTAIDSQLRERMHFQTFLQWVFTEQWQRVRAHARRQGIRIIGDLPFYPPHDSADVWARRELFELKPNGQPKLVAGAPPDVFSTKGQRWGNPVYRWSAHRRDGFAWWYQRIAVSLQRYDLLRLDHFRGYANTWRIPVQSPDGRRGYWISTPGRKILQGICRRWPQRPFLAEDLGLFSPNAEHLLREFGIDGMRVWVFGWSGLRNNIHDPRNVQKDFYFYTSTHDTNTIRGWWNTEARWFERKHLRAYLGRVTDVRWQAIEDVYASQADVAMVQLQDVLGFGAAARVNTPGRIRGNWSWRFPRKILTRNLARRLRQLTQRYA